jgi:hypothetical protein
VRKLLRRLLGWDDGAQGFLPEYLANKDLTPGMIPPRDAPWSEIARFSLTFDGCWRKGSFNRCADVPISRGGSTLSEMRACLTHEMRTMISRGSPLDSADEAFIRDLLERMRKKVGQGEYD